MAGLAQEILDKMPSDFDMVPVKVVSLSPLRVQISGDPAILPAVAASGVTLTVGAIGYALWKPPTPPLIIPVEGATAGGGGGGGGGAGFIIYTHTQSVTSSSWTINHNLGHDPIVEEVVLSDGSIAEGYDVTHTSTGTQTVIGFDLV